MAASSHKLFYAYRCAGSDEKPSLWAIRASIAQGFPVAVGARLPASFSGDETARRGVVTPPDASDPCSDGHAFSVVGYDDARRMLTCQNSWGTDWGANGLFYWPYDMVDLIMDAWTLRKAAV
jgi:C1A family cysteine protease